MSRTCFRSEFLTIVRDRLTEDGVYCQWFPLFQSEPGAVLAILNTFRQVFPEVRAFSTGGGTLSILASKKPLRADTDRLERVNAQVGHRLEANDSPFAEPLFVLATEALSDAAVSRIVDDYSAVQTFEFPVIAAAAFRASFAGVITSFSNQIAGRLHTVIPDAEPGSAMLYEAVRGQLDPRSSTTPSSISRAAAIRPAWQFRGSGITARPGSTNRPTGRKTTCARCWPTFPALTTRFRSSCAQIPMTPGKGRRLTSKHCLRTTNHPPRRSAA